MPSTADDSTKRRASVNVLFRLGEDMKEVLERHLRRYGLSLDGKDGSKFSLDQLHFGLSVLLGEGMANNLLQQITKEIDLLKYEDTAAA